MPYCTYMFYVQHYKKKHLILIYLRVTCFGNLQGRPSPKPMNDTYCISLPYRSRIYKFSPIFVLFCFLFPLL